MADVLERLSGALDRICRLGAVAAVLAMVLAICIQIVARYFLNSPPSWTEEAARYAMVWAGLLGATAAFRGRTDPVLLRLRLFDRGRGRVAGEALRVVATFLFLGPIWYACVFGPGLDVARGFVGRSLGRTAETSGISMIWFTIALPIAISVIFVHLAAGAVSSAVSPAAEGTGREG
jgi:TRAP-type C4-dicarboxylate transport system permease small subunit